MIYNTSQAPMHAINLLRSPKDMADMCTAANM